LVSDILESKLKDKTYLYADVLRDYLKDGINLLADLIVSLVKGEIKAGKGGRN
jgi:hypothetical protein